MSWISKLYMTYEHNKKVMGEMEKLIKGKEEDENKSSNKKEKSKPKQWEVNCVLLPMCCNLQKAHIEITLDKNGKVIEAHEIEKNDAETIIPTTEDSMDRGSGIAPHALFDKLQYIAGDLSEYVESKNDKLKFQECFKAYIENLEKWADVTKFPEIRTIYNYVKQGRMIADLKAQRVLSFTDGKLDLKKPKSSEIKYPVYDVVTGEVTGALVRFCVKSENVHDEAVYKNIELFKEWEKICLDNNTNEGLCYVTGKDSPLAGKYSKYIRSTGDQGKIISEGKASIFVGRFGETKDALQIGKEVSEKAHNALKWLIQRQGYNTNGLIILLWRTKNLDICNPMDPYDKDLKIDDEEDVDTAEGYARILRDMLYGKFAENKDKINWDDDEVNLLILDSATPGRISVNGFYEYGVRQYIDNLLYWYESMSWRMWVGKDGNYKRAVRSPTPRQIFNVCFGDSADNKIEKQFYQEILPCMVERQNLPRAYLNMAFNTLCNKAGYDNKYVSWDQALSIMCAMMKKIYKEGVNMSLDENDTSRDYLFGRLLAVADMFEYGVLKRKKEDRATTATRYFNQFRIRPANTWLTIYSALNPYFQNLKSEKDAKAVKWCQNSINYIMSKFDNEDFVSNKSLGPKFFLGYENQKNYNKNEENSDESEDIEED